MQCRIIVRGEVGVARACAVREPARGAVGKIIRLKYDHSDLLAQHALAWVARPVDGDAGSTLFDEEHTVPWMSAVHDALLIECVALTKGQCCADSFLLRPFRLTATLGERVLKYHPFIRTLLALGACTEPTKSLPELMTHPFGQALCWSL